MNERFRFTLLLGGLILGLFAPSSCFAQVEYDFEEVNGPRRVEVLMSSQLRQTLHTVYSNVSKELPFCLHGEVKENAVLIKRATLPEVIVITDSTARKNSKICKGLDNYLGLVHNHGMASCEPSGIDIKRFAYNEEALIETISCFENSESSVVNYKHSFYVYVKQRIR